MTLSDRNYLLLEQWKVTASLIEHQDDVSWRKLYYFITANGVLISILAIRWSTVIKIGGCSSSNNIIILSLFGLIVSIVWTLVQRRGQYFQLYRINQAMKMEEELKINNERILTLFQYGLGKQNLVTVPWSVKKYGIQDLLVLLSFLITLFWLILLIGQLGAL